MRLDPALSAPSGIRSGTASDAALPAATSAGPTEIVKRPDPGLARGAVEGPSWLFFAIAGGAVLLSALYLLHRLGRLEALLPFLRRQGPVSSPRSSIPPSQGGMASGGPRRGSIPPPRRGSIPPPSGRTR